MKGNNTPTSSELPYDSLLPTYPPYTHKKNPGGWQGTRPCGTCNLPTDHPPEQQPGCASRAMTRQREGDSEQRLSEFVFPSSGRTKSRSRQVPRQNWEPLPLGRTGLMTQRQTRPFPEARPFPLASGSQPGCSFLKPPAWPLVKKTGDRWLLREPGDR